MLVGLGLSLGVEVGWLFLCRKGVHFSEKFGRGFFFRSGLVDVEHPERFDTANIQSYRLYCILSNNILYHKKYYFHLFSIIPYAILFYETKRN